MKYKAFKIPPTLSFALIVKNEERYIRECLESILTIADEIILVDTGSTDRTKEIAQEYTEKVYDFEWCDNFAKARNFADSKCTKGWIFSIDGDEILPVEEHYKIRMALLNPQIIGHMVETWNYTNFRYTTNKEVMSPYKKDFKWIHSSYKTRLYQNVPHIFWEGKIHELNLDSMIHTYGLGHVTPIGTGAPIVHHYGSDDVRNDIQKQEQYLKYGMIKLKTVKTFNSYYEIGCMHEGIGNLEEALGYFKKAYEKKTDVTRPDLLANCVRAYKNISSKLGKPRLNLKTGKTESHPFLEEFKKQPVVKPSKPTCKEGYNPTVSLIVVSYGDKVEETEECLKTALKGLDYLNGNDEIILILNTPSERFQLWVSEHRHFKYDGCIKLIMNRINLGWTSACNQGAKEATGEILVFSNYDVIYPHFWKKELCKYFSISPQVGAVGGISDNVNQHRKQYYLTPFQWDTHPEEIKELMQIKLEKEYHRFEVVDYLIGYCLAVRKSAFENVGGFDEETFDKSIGFDDDDLSLALKKERYVLIVAHDVMIYHNWSRVFDKQYEQALQVYKKRFLKKWKQYFEDRQEVNVIPKIYDCFLFYNEYDLLDIRLNLLYEHVEKFILVESKYTFSSKEKPLYYDKVKDDPRFKKFKDKIIHVIHENKPSENRWDNEAEQRNFIVTGLHQCTYDNRDVILISDIDEIPNPICMPLILSHEGTFALEQRFCYYFFNNFAGKWRGTVASSVKYFTTPQKIRDSRNSIRIIENGGWHFSYLGDAEHIANKIGAFSHSEYDTDHFKDTKRIEECINNCEDLFERGYEYQTFDPKELPDYVLNNEKFKRFIKK